MEDLVTARLVLHPLTVAEARRLVVGAASERTHGELWAPGYPDEGDVVGARRFLRSCASTGDPQPFGPYEIRRRQDGLAIGGVAFHGLADDRGIVTIGYGLVPSAQGRGYATEALRALLEFTRDNGVRGVEGDTDQQNAASQRVMNAVGMRLVAQDDRLKYYRISWPDGPASAVPGAAELS
ncbi:GNAT family N-acetyltransferase [Streptomyces sp. 2R]|uniref:GNAT family N-acetyltransferase n=1 Tax=Streptomyces sp. 2R TaxID=1883452 RepID=UPI000B9197DD|nr:GNAT family N-acetyltransferase [Streptomyces sp. 2R]OXY84712.1 GNAT family N-acetyltransferase [Streptomyces sp. 2R]